MTSVGVHIDQLFFRTPGGIGTYVRELLPALARTRPDVELTLFHGRIPRPGPEPDWMPGIPRVSLPTGLRVLYPSWALGGRPALPPSLRGLDIVHAPSPVAVPPVGPDQRLVVTVHDVAFLAYPDLFPPVWRTLFRLGLRRAARRADAVIAASEHTAEDLVLRAGIGRERIHVVPLAASLPASIDPPDETLGRLRIPGPYVLFVGTLEPRKNLLALVRAYRRAIARCGLPHALVLAGPEGWRTAALHRELALPVPGRVVMTGRVSAPDLDALYRAADALAYPSLYEGFGLPVLEAMARGVPVVASGTSSIPEVTGDAALLVDPRSVEELAGALERVLTDPEQAQRLAAAGRARSARFSWDRTARATAGVYDTVVGP